MPASNIPQVKVVMKRAAEILNVIAFAALFFDYALALAPPQPAGTRRFLQIYAGQLPTGSFPKLTLLQNSGVTWSEAV